METQNILIFGGSFDPIHCQHIKILKTAIKFIKPDKIYVFPSYLTPLKETHFASASKRFEMAKMVFEKISRKIIVHPYEINQNKKTYTHQTINWLKKKYPRSKLHLLIGSDCLANFKKWRKYNYIIENSTLLVAKRKGFISGLKTDFNVKTIPAVFDKISSTDIRHKILLTGKIPLEIPHIIRKYISKHKLYASHWHKYLKKNLSHSRYIHTVASADLAVKLASLYKQNKTDASIAALLHDCAKKLNNKQLIEYVLENKLKIPMRESIILHHSAVLHSFVSADIAKKVFKITNKKILRAISLHTLGDSDMTIFDKIIYIADVASVDRKYGAAALVRKVAFKNLDKALKIALEAKLNHAIEKAKWLSLHSINLWNKLIEQRL
jgi:nicotinate-nucleotide adenylyltransferase